MSLIGKFLERRKRRKELKALKEAVNKELFTLNGEIQKHLHSKSDLVTAKQISDQIKDALLRSREIDRALGKRHLPDYEKHLGEDW